LVRTSEIAQPDLTNLEAVDLLPNLRAASVQREPWRDTPPDLSGRQLEMVMVMLLVQGLGDREITEPLKISDETVRSRGKALYCKLSASSRAQVVALSRGAVAGLL